MKTKTYRITITTFLCLHLFLLSIGNSVAAFNAQPCPTPQIPFPPTAKAANELRFAVIGDTGEICTDKPKKCDLVRQMLEVRSKTNFNQLFFLGDNVYEDGNPKEFDDKLYKPYRRLVESGVILRGVVGNHDVKNAEGAEIQLKFFRAPNTVEQLKFFGAPVNTQLQFLPTITETYYSFTEKPQLVEFFALDSSLLAGDYSTRRDNSIDYPKNKPEQQTAWLEKQLERSQKAGTKWRIVLAHHPLYSSAKKHGEKVNDNGSLSTPSEMRAIRGRIEDTLVKFGVKLFLAGHDHVYEHIEPQRGISHFVSGAGAELRTGDFDRDRLPNYHVCGKANELSFMLFSVKPDSITFWTIGENGMPFDAGVIQ